LEAEFIECLLNIKALNHQQFSYSKQIVNMRVQAIAKCDETLHNAQRVKNCSLIQFGCLIQWELCLPLLQPNLRSKIRRPLQFVADCLDEIERFRSISVLNNNWIVIFIFFLSFL
jgi:hypothetical protein